MCQNYANRGDGAHDNENILLVEKEVEQLAGQGLRTLLYGMKEIDWDGSRDPLEIEVGEIECDLTLLAATAVEDLLQDNVKECITDFRAAGIGVWMLTGDKGLTAKEIGVSCGLIPKQEGES
jgi:magnesium-transporting ATPase (P-type)